MRGERRRGRRRKKCRLVKGKEGERSQTNGKKKRTPGQKKGGEEKTGGGEMR